MEKRIESMNLAFILLTMVLLLSSCASFMARPSISEIVSMSQEGVPSDKIIAEMKKNEAVYYLSDEKLEDLQKKGVSYSVTNYMKDTRDRAVQQETERAMYYDTWIRDPVSGVF